MHYYQMTFIPAFFEPSFWNFTNTVAVVSALTGSIAAILAYLPLRQQRRKQRLLEKSFGADFYDAATIRNSTRYYVRPFCSSVDPAQEAEMRHVIATQEDLFTAVDKHLINDTSHRHILLLADSGMGKSSFVLNYYARNQQLPKRKRQRLAVVPLGIPYTLDVIKGIEDKKNTVLFLDAFDEDTEAIKDHRARLIQLMQACIQFKRVLITCRTQFFPKDEEIPKETGIAVVGPRKPGESGIYEFWKLYLSPLNDKQVEEFIKRRYPRMSWRKRIQARNLVNKVPLLSVRPMLLSYIPELMNAGTEIKYSFQIYKVMVDKWVERESSWVDKEQLRAFSEWLALDLFIKREQRGAERIPRAELIQLTKQKGIPLDDWKITGRSLLNRDAQGNFKFAHRSIMEYLCVSRFIHGDLSLFSVQLTDQMKTFLWETLKIYAEKERFPPLYHAISNHKDAKLLEEAFISLTQFVLAHLPRPVDGKPFDDIFLQVISSLICIILNVNKGSILSISVGSNSESLPVKPNINNVPHKEFAFSQNRSDTSEHSIAGVGWLTFRLEELPDVLERVQVKGRNEKKRYVRVYEVKNDKGTLICVLVLASEKIIFKTSHQRLRHLENLIKVMQPLM